MSLCFWKVGDGLGDYTHDDNIYHVPLIGSGGGLPKSCCDGWLRTEYVTNPDTATNIQKWYMAESRNVFITYMYAYRSSYFNVSHGGISHGNIP